MVVVCGQLDHIAGRQLDACNFPLLHLSVPFCEDDIKCCACKIDACGSCQFTRHHNCKCTTSFP